MDSLNSASPPDGYRLADLCAIADLPIRTVRYYVQIGLMDRPVGETRAARYGADHLDQLLRIKQWTAEGFSLERIRQRLQGEQGAEQALATDAFTFGMEWRAHVRVAEGVELVLHPSGGPLTATQLQRFLNEVRVAYARAQQEPASASSKSNLSEEHSREGGND